MSGTPVKNFKIFRKLCGDRVLRNVVIVTNMWGEVDLQVGEAREAELMETDIFFKPALDNGAQVARHENTIPSAENIIRLILDHDPLPLDIQRELIDEGKDITQTRAGQELNRELSAQVRKYMEEIWMLGEEMQEAINDRDQETRREREIETRKMQDEMERIENDARRFVADYQREKQELEARFAEVERIAAQCQGEIGRLNAALQSGAAASELEKEQMRNRIKEHSMSAGRTGVNVYYLVFAVSAGAAVIGPALGTLGAIAVAVPVLNLKPKLKTIIPALIRIYFALW
jgi:hypothetical protein